MLRSTRSMSARLILLSRRFSASRSASLASGTDTTRAQRHTGAGLVDVHRVALLAISCESDDVVVDHQVADALLDAELLPLEESRDAVASQDQARRANA